MEIIKIITLLCVLLNIECFGFRLQENIRNLEELGRKLENKPISEVSSDIFNRILYGRSIFIIPNCPDGTIRIGGDCVPPRPNSDYDYDG